MLGYRATARTRSNHDQTDIPSPFTATECAGLRFRGLSTFERSPEKADQVFLLPDLLGVRNYDSNNGSLSWNTPDRERASEQ
jgi:hypothetical protein